MFRKNPLTAKVAKIFTQRTQSIDLLNFDFADFALLKLSVLCG
jgi:hypothetical protein